MKDRISFIRSRENLSQREFAEKLSLSQNYVWMLENGKRAPSPRTIIDICRIFGVDKEWLETGNGSPFATTTPADSVDVENTILNFAVAIAKAYAACTQEEKDFLNRFAKNFEENLIEREVCK